MDSQEIYQQVQDHYGSVARNAGSQNSHAIAKAFGYSDEELSDIPSEANLGLSCGNPSAMASLHYGETVIDLGSGAGFDVFLAAKLVGNTGRVIGVDMNKEMLQRAKENITKARATNVDFIEGQITSVPLNSGIADCIISNCVVNLVPEGEKQQAFNEMFRLLKPGGRVAISDILARKPLTAEIRENIALYVGCIAGASMTEDYETYFRNAGFGDILIVDTESDLNIYNNPADAEATGPGLCCMPQTEPSSTMEKNVAAIEPVKSSACCSREQSAACVTVGSLQQEKSSSCVHISPLNLNEWAGSYKIFAVRP